MGNYFGIDCEPNKKFVQTLTKKDSLAKLALRALLLIILCIIGATCLILFLPKQENQTLECPISTMNTGTKSELHLVRFTKVRGRVLPITY